MLFPLDSTANKINRANNELVLNKQYQSNEQMYKASTYYLDQSLVRLETTAFKSIQRLSIEDNLSVDYVDNQRFIEQIIDYDSLPYNWDTYGAIAPNIETIIHAIQFVRQLTELQIPVYFVAPGPNGEIAVELKNREKSIEFYFYGDAEEASDYAAFDENQLIEENNFSLDAKLPILNWFYSQ